MTTTSPSAEVRLGGACWRPGQGWDAPVAAADIPGQIIVELAELKRPFKRWSWWWSDGRRWWRELHRRELEGSPLVVLEDGKPLGVALPPHLEANGRVGWQHHPDGRMYFTTADGSDPNTNGRRYTLAVVSLSGWPVPVVQWPAGSLFRRASDGHPLPVFASMGLTNKCNLRCAICGSQSHLDRTRQARRFTDIEIIRAVAATTFPFLHEVELNSYGEPTLHRDFAEIVDLINAHRCLIKLQSNATLLRPQVIDSLSRACGTVMLSVDAVGPLFEKARHLGRWSDVDVGVRALMSRRDPERLRVALYPTVTRTTLPGVIELLDWAHELGMDAVRYHTYEPILNGTEERPSDEELAEAKARLVRWVAEHPDGPDVHFGLDTLRKTAKGLPPSGIGFGKMAEPRYHSHPVVKGHPNAHPVHACFAPWQQMDIGLDGQLFACCRTQTTTLGRVDSPQALCAAWFGPTYDSLRLSLRHKRLTADVLPECADCCANFGLEPLPPASLAKGVVPVRRPFDSDGGHGWRANLAYVDPADGDGNDAPERSTWTLYEDEMPLGPAHAAHADIRATGGGAFSHWGQQLYFSTSDHSDPNVNGRSYTLRRPQPVRQGVAARLLGLFGLGGDEAEPANPPPPGPRAHILAPPFQHAGGRRWRASGLEAFGRGDSQQDPWASELALFEDGQPLGPAHTLHADISAQGGGCYSHWEDGLWFSTSDDSDPNTNGRTYEVRILD